MLIITASPDHSITAFISLVRESNCDFLMNSFYDWQCNNQQPTPQGFVYIRVAPDISFKRLQKQDQSFTLADIQKIYDEHEHYFVHKTTLPTNLHHIPILVLNGNINFENDFSQFYTHLFSIKKFFKEVKDKEDKAAGVYVTPKKKHRGCKC